VERDAIKRTIRYSLRLRNSRDSSSITGPFIIWRNARLFSRARYDSSVLFDYERALNVAYNSVGMPVTIANRS